jgi:hypothetical protein
MLARVGDPQQVAGLDRFATWRVALSEDPNPGWRRQFLTYAYGSGLFAGGQITVVPGALVFTIERSALALVCGRIDQWIAQANEPDAPTILAVDDEPDIGPMTRDILERLGMSSSRPPIHWKQFGSHGSGAVPLTSFSSMSSCQ